MQALIGYGRPSIGRRLAGYGMRAAILPIFTINDGDGNAQVSVPEGGSVEVSLDDRPTVTLTNTSGNADIGFLYAPSVTGTVITSSTLAIDLGIVFYEGDGPITIVQDILRDGTPIASDIRASNAPETYSYTVVAADIGATVQLRSVLTNGSNVLTFTTNLIVPGTAPILEAGAVGWWDFGDDAHITKATGGAGTEIMQFADKSAAGNNLTQSVLDDMPDRVETAINGFQAAQFGNTAHMRMAPTDVRTVFFVSNAPVGSTAGVAPIIASKYDSGSDQKYIFLRCDGRVDYDLSLDGAGTSSADSGTVYADTGDSGSGEDVTLPDLSVIEREGIRLYCIVLDQDMTGADVFGALRTTGTLRNNGTLFGELVIFPSALTASEINAVANDIAPRWGLTWSDI